MKTVAEAAREYSGRVKQATRTDDETGFQAAFHRCESPIEQAYCLEIFQVPGVGAIAEDFEPQHLASLSGKAARILVFAQQPIPPYRADFLLLGISPRSAEPIFVIVECDGEAYHSEREQIRRDTERQAALQRTGFAVVRFSGSEIHRDPTQVVRRTLEAFRAHGWAPAMAGRWVNLAVLLPALAALRSAT